ncbi:hypothetical protein F53441_7357 [Fusarium austroafricanum]|uniref:Uncharacterized protein n=1 Tax=Fusarium austroafricanum TaxID=2364996 RepID=A0A8H4KGT4_9HYPO|nr:hypothetical protein F53441_7357 [Fusarium austroafricanum]
MSAAWKTNLLAALWLSAVIVGATPDQPQKTFSSAAAEFTHPSYVGDHGDQYLANIVDPRREHAIPPIIPRQQNNDPAGPNTPLPAPIPTQPETTAEPNDPPAPAATTERPDTPDTTEAPAPPIPTDNKPEDPKPEDPKPEDPKPEEPKPEDPDTPDIPDIPAPPGIPEIPSPPDSPNDPNKPDNPKPEDPKPDNPKPDDPKPEEPKPEEPKPEDPKPEELKPEDPKPEGPDDCEKKDPLPFDCPAKETPTITTSVFPEESIIWGTVPADNVAIPTDINEIDEEMSQYFQQVFDDENISINDAQHPDVQCQQQSGNDVPRDCFVSVYSKFCGQVNGHAGDQLTQNLTGADADSGSQEKRAPINLRRHMLRERAEACDGWVFEVDWSGAKGECQIPCSDSMYAFSDECFDSENSFLEGTIDVGCGTYKYTAILTSSTTAPPVHLTGLPTLTGLPGPISTPDGSSCAQTATNTQCALGGGDGQACVENTYCASWVSTKPTQAPAPPEVKPKPLELGPVFCKDRGGSHKDIDPGAVRSLADAYCEANLPVKLEPGSPKSGTTKSSIYYYEVSWVEGCNTTVESQDPYTPLGKDGPMCKDLFVKAYAGCDNGGIGGYIDAGCVRYMFLGAQ